MQEWNYDCGNVLARYPYGADIDDMRSLYGYAANGVPSAYWLRRVNGIWDNLEVALPLADGVWPVSAAVGQSVLGDAVVVGELSDSGSVVAFNSTLYPPTSSSSWSSPTVNVNTWRPPAVAGKTTGAGQLWVASVARENLRSTDCNTIRNYRSANTFATTTSSDQANGAGCGTMHEPALTYNEHRQRFVQFYVRHDAFGAAGPDFLTKTGTIYARTSADGTTWTNPQDLGIFTDDAVDISCCPVVGAIQSPGTCQQV
jgi:hypothetical protein